MYIGLKVGIGYSRAQTDFFFGISPMNWPYGMEFHIHMQDVYHCDQNYGIYYVFYISD